MWWLQGRSSFRPLTGISVQNSEHFPYNSVRTAQVSVPSRGYQFKMTGTFTNTLAVSTGFRPLTGISVQNLLMTVLNPDSTFCTFPSPHGDISSKFKMTDLYVTDEKFPSPHGDISSKFEGFYQKIMDLVKFPSPHGDISSKYVHWQKCIICTVWVSVPSRGYQFKICTKCNHNSFTVKFPSPHGDISSKFWLNVDVECSFKFPSPHGDISSK